MLGVADLEPGMARLETLVGVRPVRGGSHPEWGTHNALISLGSDRYLELIAPDPAQTQFVFPYELHTLVEPRVIAWIAKTSNIRSSAAIASAAGYQVEGPTDRSRLRPDGTHLKWKLCRVITSLGRDGVQPIPHFIEWDSSSPHPSEDSPAGCTLQTFGIEYPDPSELGTVLKKLGVVASVTQAPTARLILVLKTPKGRVELS